MSGDIIIKGRLVGPTNVQLDEPVVGMQGELEVILRQRRNGGAGANESVQEFLRRLPPGSRSREEIDRRIHEERDGWARRA